MSWSLANKNISLSYLNMQIESLLLFLLQNFSSARVFFSFRVENLEYVKCLERKLFPFYIIKSDDEMSFVNALKFVFMNAGISWLKNLILSIFIVQKIVENIAEKHRFSIHCYEKRKEGKLKWADKTNLINLWVTSFN